MTMLTMLVVRHCIRKLQKSLVDLEKLHSSVKGENLVLPTPAGNKVLKSQLFVDTFSESTQHTFLDYLAAGFEVNFMVAVDFTGNVCTSTICSCIGEFSL